MNRGRPIKGLDNIEKLEGSEAAKERLKLVLGTLTGEISVEEACKVLGISRSRLFEIRKQALEGALKELQPSTPGRKSVQEDERDKKIQELEKLVDELETNLEVSRTRTELALTMPHVLREQMDSQEKKKRNQELKQKKKAKRKQAKKARKKSKKK